MTDTMTSEVVAEKDIGPEKTHLLRLAIQRHRDADKFCDDAKEALHKARTELNDAWQAAGNPTGKFKMWLYGEGDMLVQLFCDEGDFGYTVDELKIL